MSELQGQPRILFDQQHRHPFGVEPPDDIEDLQHDERCQPERRLIEQQQFRSPHQGASHRQHLLFAARERAAKLGLAFAQDRKQFVGVSDVLLNAGLVVARVGSEFQILQHRQPRKNLAAFRRLAEAQPHDLMRRQVLNLTSRPDDPSGASLDGTRDGHQRRCLTGAVRSDDGDDLALIDLDRDPLENLNRPVASVQLFDSQQFGQGLAAPNTGSGPSSGRRSDRTTVAQPLCRLVSMFLN